MEPGGSIIARSDHAVLPAESGRHVLPHGPDCNLSADELGDIERVEHATAAGA